MLKYKMAVVFCCVVLIFLAGCDLPDSSSTPTETYGPTPTFTPTSVSIAEEALNGPVAQGGIGDAAIATPPGFNFWLLSADYLVCGADKYIVLKVVNAGGMPFSWADTVVWGTQNDWAQSNTPFYKNPDECPAGEGADKLSSGNTAYLYAKLVHNSPSDVFKIVVQLCNQPWGGSLGTGCVEREIGFQLTVMVDPSIIHIMKEILCWIGPGPKYPVVRTIKAGETLQIVARSQVEGYLVVQDTKYGVFCYLKGDGVEIPASLDMSAFPEITPPPLPTSTPTVTPTQRAQFNPRAVTPSPTPVPPPK